MDAFEGYIEMEKFNSLKLLILSSDNFSLTFSKYFIILIILQKLLYVFSISSKATLTASFMLTFLLTYFKFLLMVVVCVKCSVSHIGRKQRKSYSYILNYTPNN